MGRHTAEFSDSVFYVSVVFKHLDSLPPLTVAHSNSAPTACRYLDVTLVHPVATAYHLPVHLQAGSRLMLVSLECGRITTIQ